MQKLLLPEAEGYARTNKRRRIWRRFVRVIACLVVFCTTYALIFPAITMEKNPCSLDEHTHSENCYEKVVSEAATLVCSYESLGVHVHTSDCYNSENQLSCGQADYLIHAHNADCMDENGALVCQIPEVSAHEHTDACSGVMEAEPAKTEVTATPATHSHGDACYTIELGEQICQLVETEGHTHGQACYTQGELICPLSEQAGHAHGEECTKTVLVCDLTEQSHIHTDACYQTNFLCDTPESEGHTHGTACYESLLTCDLSEVSAHMHTDDCYEKIAVLTCQLDEDTAPEATEETLEATESVAELICTEPVAQVHIHDDNCFAEDPAQDEPLTCTITEGHVHADGCYDELGTLICTETENHTHSMLCYGTWKLICTLEEHTHNLVCQNDPEADVETEADWMATFADVALTGEWPADVIAIARSQLGYKESTRNYEVLDDGKTIRGYTRYGAWYGYPHDDWCAMFVSFCLNYAGVEQMPLDAYCPNWTQALTEANLYYPSGDYTPKSGDLIFFDFNENNASDHVGIVTEIIPATETKPAMVKTIEGNSNNCVMEQEYVLDDRNILGYGTLPEQKPDEILLCGLEEHAHDEACMDENGSLVCELEEHTHSVECTLPRELSEEDRAKVEEVIALIDAIPSHEEISDALFAFYQANDAEGEIAYNETLNAQVGEAYRAYMALDEPLREYVTNADRLMELEYIWSQITLEEPVQSYNLEGGEYLFPAKEGEFPRFYQTSSYAIYYAARTFVLIPASELEDGEWVADPIDWSGSANANYVVAYCSDDRTGISPTDQDTYRTYSIDNSRFTTDLQQRKIAAIIGNSYPFLTLAEARAVMAVAGVEGAQQCTEHELITATQWAVWATVETVEEGKLVESDLEDYDFSADPLLNPLEAGPAMDDAVKARIINVKNWLCSLAEPEKLAVTDYDPVITANEDGTFNLSITVNLNRAIVEDEHAQFHLQAGGKSTTVTQLPAGQDSFTISAENLTEAELANAKVNLNISGEHMQAYFFDSKYYQDMLSGKWEHYSEDITVELGLELIDVAVTKVWTEENTTVESIDVQLLADGKPYGDPVTLSSNNDWHYIWEDLKRYSVTEINKAPEDRTEIEYSIMEVPLPGYYSSDLTVDSFDSVAKVQQWQQVETFDGPGTYVFVSDAGALGAEHPTNMPYGWQEYFLTLVPVDLSSVSLTDESVMWNVVEIDPSASEEDRRYYLESVKYPGVFINSAGNLRMAISDATKGHYYFTDGVIAAQKTSKTAEYFDGLYAYGWHGYTDNKDEAMRFRLYKLVELELPSAEKNFVLTNTKIQQDTPTVDISVNKQWRGRLDMVYPESVTVQLMQTDIFDGTVKPYGYPVVLNAENEWTYTWSGLPEYVLKDGENISITYSVVEVDIPKDYECKITKKSDTYEFVITNTWKPESVNVELQKIDSSTSRLLPGAEFTLYWTTNNVGVTVPGATGVKGFKKGTFVTDETGKITMEELNPGETYYLVETAAPTGYSKLDYAIGFTVTKTGSIVRLNLLTGKDDAEVQNGSAPILTIQNRIYYELPETGGPGTTSYGVGGLLLMAAAVILLYIHTQKVRKDERPSF